MNLAKRYHLSDWAVGVTVVAFGGSLPELIVNLYAASAGITAIALSNILGSVTANVLLVLGAAAVIFPLSASRRNLSVYVPIGVLSAAAVGLAAAISLPLGRSGWILTRLDGIFLLGAFALFMLYTLRNAGREGVPMAREDGFSPFKLLGFIVLGFLGLFLGSHWIVQSAVELAVVFGVSQSFIGFTIVALGTSLPELAASVVAARRKNAEIAVGNVVGSNIFNFLFILGISSFVRPLPFQAGDIRDWGVSMLVSLLLLVFLVARKPHVLGKAQGAAFLLVYIFYVVYLFLIQKA